MAKGTRRARTGIALTALALSTGACILTETSRDQEHRAKQSAAPLATHADVTGLGADTIKPTRLLFDDEASKLLYVGNYLGRPAMRLCNHDATGCTAHYLGEGRATDALIDHSAKKLLVATVVGTDSDALMLQRCGLDGSACTGVNITGSHPNVPGGATLVADEGSGTLYALACANAQPLVRRCNMDGSSCSEVQLEGACAGVPAVAFDAANDKLLVAANDGEGAVTLHRCASDASGCTTNVIARGYRGSLEIAVDETGGRVFAVDGVSGENGDGVTLTRCNADGSQCTNRELEVAGNARVNVIRGELVVSTVGPSATLHRCALDSDRCSATSLAITDFYAGDYGSDGDLAYDAAHDTFLVSTAATGTDTPTVFTIGPIVITAPRDGSSYRVKDVAAGPGEMPYFGRSYFDDATRKLYVLAESDIRGISEDRRFHRLLTRCEPDGTQCTSVDGKNFVKILGVVDGALVMLGLERERPSYPGQPEERPLEVLRCALDGTSCRHSVVFPSAYDNSYGGVLDGKRAFVVAAAPPESTDVHAHLYSCRVDLDTCDAPVALPMFLSSISAMAFDAAASKLLVFHYDGTGYSIARCAPDGSRCTSNRVPVPVGIGDARVIATASTLTVAVISEGKISVARCAPDGTACKTNDVSYGSGSIDSFDVTKDRATGDLLFVVAAQTNDWKATLLRCRDDGTACVASDMSAGQPAQSALRPTALFDSLNRTVLAVAENETKRRASLYTMTLSDVPPEGDAGAPPANDGGTPPPRNDAGHPGVDAGGGSSGGGANPKDGGSGKTW